MRLRVLPILVLLIATDLIVPLPLRGEDRPNIVIILCDDMGFSDLGCYGGEIDTPNLDRLAASGLRFTDFHNNAKCSETRASLLTGLWHQQSKNLRKPGHVTMAEVLREAGYTTLMSGKWHLAGTPPQRGFDRYFGFLSGAINFFTGKDWQTGENLMRLDEKPYQVPDDFYSTDAFTDYAIKFLEEAFTSDRPFFLYLAHNAPHFPLHALPEDIAKYEGRYRVGWDRIREQRYRRLLELGVIDTTWRLSPRDPKVEPWTSMRPEDIDLLEPMMAVYAAMVDRLDQNVGRLVQYLEANEQLDNTLILFLSDNGACPYQRVRTPNVPPGPKESEIAYDARWANMCNTPLRLYKQYAHAGGTATPLIVHWPAGLGTPGKFRRFPGHLVDLMPTVIDLADATYPERQGETELLPLEGVSLVPVFAGDKEQREQPLFWEFSGNRAVRVGDWKLVAERGAEWELYNLANDRSEVHNLADSESPRLRRLAATYDRWAERVGARSNATARKMQASRQSQLIPLDE